MSTKFFAIIKPNNLIEFYGKPPKKIEGLSCVYAIERIYEVGVFQPIYYGKAKSLKSRIHTHVRDSNIRSMDICKEIRRLQESGISIRIKLIAVMSEQEANRTERLLIKAGRLMGFPLLNMRDGGFYISVIQYSLEKVYIKQWESILDASKELSISDTNISACCKRKYKSAGGYIWRYADDPLTSAEIGAHQTSLFDSDK